MIKILFLHISLFHLFLFGKQHFDNIIIDKVVSVYDGDTFKVNIELYPKIIGTNILIRVNGIDTPELKGKCSKENLLGKQAKYFTQYLLNKSKHIELKNTQRDKYFRIVADVYVDNKNIANELIENGLAVPYDGGTKTKNWCE
ncbi:MAG: thermonuclease family protein [Arcobacteraceae bacterium]|jgi:endonuclease YncB( thermonuclease family)|nr:thermonuclease family protein [Arcobacteraceae bacterium]